MKENSEQLQPPPILHILQGDNQILGIYTSEENARNAAQQTIRKGEAGWKKYKNFTTLPIRTNNSPSDQTHNIQNLQPNTLDGKPQ
jgi:hypothetical protein